MMTTAMIVVLEVVCVYVRLLACIPVDIADASINILFIQVVHSKL